MSSQARKRIIYGGTASCGFTLMELLVVMVIVLLLMGLLFPVVGRALSKARQTECRSRLRQFGGALSMYRAEHRGRNPDWLSSLYPNYIDDRSMYVCPSDAYHGRDGGKPDADHVVGIGSGAFSVSQQFAETDDNVGRNGIARCSYLYEFSAAANSWAWPTEWGASPEGEAQTWQSWKLMQLRKGDADNGFEPYSESRMPIIRCFHHYDEGKVLAVKESGYRTMEPMTLNVGYAGNVFVAPLKWEERADGRSETSEPEA